MEPEIFKKRAFTLVELLVVISVIALLLGILTPVLGKIRKAASRVACAGHLHSLGMAFRMYLDDHKDIMPVAALMPSIDGNQPPDFKKPIRSFLEQYTMGEKKVFRCPGDIKAEDMGRDGIAKTYYEKEGSSFEYNTSLGGKPIRAARIVQRTGAKEPDIHVLTDYAAFHGTAGRPGAKNYLYADWHVGDSRSQY